jgi:hypothetical protein
MDQPLAVGENWPEIRLTRLDQSRQRLVHRRAVAEVIDLCSQQADTGFLPLGRVGDQDNTAAQVGRAIAGTNQSVQVNHRNGPATVDEDASQPGRTARHGLEADARHHFLDAAGVQGEPMRANVKSEHEHGEVLYTVNRAIS